MDGSAVRLAIVGAGAVAEKRYLPAAGRADRVRVTHLVDLDGERARTLAAEHDVPRTASSHGEVLAETDAVVVATPPATHADIAVDCLERGVHVLCEKPLASDPEEGRRIVAAAEAADALLSVGMVRRQGRSARLLRRCVELGMAGDVHRVEAEEGGEFDWPLRTRHVFDAEQGGVLTDTGTHVLDLAFWIVGAREARVADYSDDSLGGPEANARVEARTEGVHGAVPVGVEVSFTRPLPNHLRVHGSEGVLEGRTLGGAEVRWLPDDGSDPVRLVPRDASPRPRVEDFVRQLGAFTAAVREGGPPPVPASEALLAVEVIASCHRGRRPEVRPWEAPPERSAPRSPGAAVPGG